MIQEGAHELGRVHSAEPWWLAEQIQEDQVGLAAGAQAVGEREADAAIEAGGVVEPPQRRFQRARGRERAAVGGVAAAAAGAGEHEAGVRHQLIRFSRPFHSRSRRTNFWILPVDVFGRSPNSTKAGALKCAMFCLQNSITSLSVASAPGFNVTKALGRSPHFSSGTATTAHSRTAGCLATHCSTSMVEMFSPPEMMMSFLRTRSSMYAS